MNNARRHPRCAHCDKPLAKIITDITFKPGDEPTNMDEAQRKVIGQGTVIGVKYGKAERYLTEAEAHALGERYKGTKGVGELKLTNIKTNDETRGRVIYRASVWDGASYRGPFCTLRCAAAFGHAALAAGWRKRGGN